VDLTLETHPEGVILPLKVSAGAAREGVTGTHDGMLKVAVRAAPEKGKANKSVLALLSVVLGVRRQDLRITRGATSQRKTLLVRGKTPDEVCDRIERAVPGEPEEGRP
jgi:uncharacterized protein (TIGR00251 family)